MAIDLVDVNEVRTGRGGKTKGEKYGKYAAAIQKHLSWIKDQIGSSKDGVIRIKNADIGNEMSGEFAKKNPTSLYWGLKYVLFNEGIVVDTGTHKSGDKLLIMRLGTPEDTLPPSLSKYLDTGEEGGDESTDTGDEESEE